MSVDRCEDDTRLAPLPEGVALRMMKASDLPHVRALHRSLLPVSYPAAFFVQLLVNPRQVCLVATERGTIIGFASASMGFTEPDSVGGVIGEPSSCTERKCSESCSDIPRLGLTLLTLGVLPAYRRRGIGRSLVHGVVQHLEASCGSTTSCHSPEQDSKIAVLVQVQVAQTNSAGRCFYEHLGMTDQCDDLRIRLGPGSRTSVMAGVLCV